MTNDGLGFWGVLISAAMVDPSVLFSCVGTPAAKRRKGSA
jgi:hypothetical protein